MLFKTNYRSLNEAKKYINILEKNLNVLLMENNKKSYVDIAYNENIFTY